MLPELYRPSCVDELAWSREKRETLLGSMQEQLSGNAAPHICLLYGPSGCGKLSAVEVLFRQAVCNVKTNMTRANCDDANTSDNTFYPDEQVEIQTCHTCDNSAVAYGQFLQRIILLLTTSIDNIVNVTSKEFLSDLSKHSIARIQNSQSSSGSLTLQEYTTEYPTTFSTHEEEEEEIEENREKCNEHERKEAVLNRHVEKRWHAICARAFVVKLYGEDASEYLHRYTREFIWAYERICENALCGHNAHNKSCNNVDKINSSIASTESKASNVAKMLQRHQIFFIHTVHDTHSPRVDLAESIPSELLNSSRVSLFHCTPITPINMMRRLCDIVNAEVNKLSTATCNKAAASAQQSKCKTTPTKVTSKVVNRKRSRKTQWLQSNKFISTSDLEVISQTSQGDLRQALLQTQWVLLVPTTQTSTQSIEEVAEHKSRKQQEEEEKKQKIRKIHVKGNTESETKHDVNRGNRNNKIHSVASDKWVNSNITTSRDKDEEEVVFVKEIKHSDNKGETCKLEKNGKAKSSLKSSVMTHIVECKREDSVSVLDLLTQQEEESESKSTTLVSDKECTVGIDSGICKGQSSEETTITTNGLDSSSQTVERISVVTVRDEYLGLSHATGRLLTQKYALWDVLRLLNVSPRKVLNYLTNNMPVYFSSDQICEYALCASSASECDALRESTIAYNNDFHHPTYETEQDDEAIVISMSHNVLDYMSLVVFDKTYRVRHHSVSVPRTFMPQRPPPFMPHAYPRIRCNRSLRFTGYSNNINKNSSFIHNTDNAPTLHSSTDVYNSFMARIDAAVEKARGTSSEVTLNHSKWPSTFTLRNNTSLEPITRTPPITSEEEDIVRESLPSLVDRCGCSEAVVMDYYSLAQYIILDRVNTFIDKTFNVNNTSTKVKNESKTTLPSVLQHTNRSMKATSNLIVNNNNNSNNNKSSNTVLGQSARRTTFRFTAQNEHAKAPRTLLVGSNSMKSQRRSCNELQFKLLRRGLQPNTFLRDEFFYINTNPSNWNSLPNTLLTESSSPSPSLSSANIGNSVHRMNREQDVLARNTRTNCPMIPADDIIEDFSD